MLPKTDNPVNLFGRNKCIFIYWNLRSSSSNFSWVISASAWVPRSRTMCVQRP